ncbi:MAG: hypothetical protein K8L97_32730 [Anaerolineae bacterium]|nr:hypothetical protein [Anaerolineae bacterium]
MDIRRWALALLMAVLMVGAAYAQDVTPELTPEVTAEATPESTPVVMEFPGPGSYTVRQTFGEVERSYRIYIPANYAEGDEAVALIIVMHGAGGTGAGIESFSGFNELSEQEGFIVIYPNGVDNVWADGRDGDPRVGVQDDVGYLARVIELLKQSLRIDPARIYATGHSMGGFMAFRLACELPDQIAAIAPVAATFPNYLREECADSPPVPMLMAHGTDDNIVPWAGVPIGYFSAGESLGFWAIHNECATRDPITALEDIDPDDGTFVLREGYTDCAEGADVQLYGVYHGGHTWPGHVIGVSFELGLTSKDLDATAVIWEFFKEHPFA